MLFLDIELVGKGLGSSWSIGGIVNMVWLSGVESNSVFSLLSGIGIGLIGEETSSIESYAICFVSTLLGIGVLVNRIDWSRSVCWWNASRRVLVDVLGMRSPALSVQRRMSLLHSLRTVLVGSGIDGVINKSLVGEVEASGAEAELVLAKIWVVEAVLGSLSVALAEWGIGLEARDKTSIAWNNAVLWDLWLISVCRSVRGSIHVVASPGKELVVVDLGLSEVDGTSGVVVVSKLSHFFC